ncbi:MAG: ATP-grasp domain-containing protein [Actinobacteria bacterium]|nr:ATP-grasp domain-containing protein [Actinomycetota bacterium]
MASTEMPPAVAPQAGPAAHDSFDVLILDAASRQSLTTARRLGRAGLRVALAECAADCGPSSSALSFRSRYSARNVVLPSVATEPDAFADAVVAFARTYPTRVILPTADAGIAALAPRRAELATLGARLALAPDAALLIATDKDRTLAIARDLGIDYPQTVRIAGVWDLPAAIDALGFPFVLKPTVSITRQSAGRLYAVEVVNEVEALKVVQTHLSAGAGVLAQQWASGRREGVTLLIADGEVRAACAHVAYRTSPALGGASVLRESVPLADDVHSAAVRLATAIGLDGVCEVEFRRDADGRPLLMEVNARLAGTIENAVHSGVDLPLMLWQWATGDPVPLTVRYRTGVRTRWLRGDLRWLRDNWGRAGRPDSMSRTRALVSFCAEFVRTFHYDCLDRRDPGPVLAELRTMTRGARKSRSPRTFPI